MKRRPLIIATVVTVAALACVVPVWEDVWLWLRYGEDKETIYGVSSVPIGLRGLWGDRAVRTFPLTQTLWKKRFSWLPGPDYLVEAGVCGRCDGLSFRHSCTGNVELMRIGPYETLATAPCTCPTCHPERER